MNRACNSKDTDLFKKHLAAGRVLFCPGCACDWNALARLSDVARIGDHLLHVGIHAHVTAGQDVCTPRGQVGHQARRPFRGTIGPAGEPALEGLFDAGVAARHGPF